MADSYYIIANVDKSDPSQPHSSEWPKLIAYSFSQRKILLEEGKGHGLMGGAISLEKFNPADWKDIFISTNSTWFLDMLSNGTISGCTDEESLKKILNNKCGIKLINY